MLTFVMRQQTTFVGFSVQYSTHGFFCDSLALRF